MGQLLKIGRKDRLKVAIIEDDPVQSLFWRLSLERRYGPRISIETYTDPREGLEKLTPDTDLALVDWLMPHLDGAELIRLATERGIDPKKIVVFSVKPAEEIRKRFGSQACLAIIEKGNPSQEDALFQILDKLILS